MRGYIADMDREVMGSQITKIRLLIIGNEIISGRRQDKHWGHCQSYFSAWGVTLTSVHYCRDDLEELAALLTWLRATKDVCFCFGGLGATPDDQTRAAAAKAFNLSLVQQPEAAALILRQFGEQAVAVRLQMADLPEGAALIPNECNNIPGFSLANLHFLPGFPQMAWPMLDWVINNCYTFDRQEQARYRSLMIYDVAESELVEILSTTQKQLPEITISSLPKFPEQGRLMIEVGAEGSAAAVEEALARLRVQLDGCAFRYKER